MVIHVKVLQYGVVDASTSYGENAGVRQVFHLETARRYDVSARIDRHGRHSSRGLDIAGEDLRHSEGNCRHEGRSPGFTFAGNIEFI